MGRSGRVRTWIECGNKSMKHRAETKAAPCQRIRLESVSNSIYQPKWNPDPREKGAPDRYTRTWGGNDDTAPCSPSIGPSALNWFRKNVNFQSSYECTYKKQLLWFTLSELLAFCAEKVVGPFMPHTRAPRALRAALSCQPRKGKTGSVIMYPFIFARFPENEFPSLIF